MLFTVLRSQRLQSMIKDAAAVQGLLLRLNWNGFLEAASSGTGGV
jgi:hypothetical protein